MRRSSASWGGSEAGGEALASEGLFDQGDGPGDADESGTLGPPCPESLSTPLRWAGVAQLRTCVAIARPRCVHRTVDVMSSESRQHERLTAQPLVAPVLEGHWSRR